MLVLLLLLLSTVVAAFMCVSSVASSAIGARGFLGSNIFSD